MPTSAFAAARAPLRRAQPRPHHDPSSLQRRTTHGRSHQAAVDHRLGADRGRSVAMAHGHRRSRSQSRRRAAGRCGRGPADHRHHPGRHQRRRAAQRRRLRHRRRCRHPRRAAGRGPPDAGQARGNHHHHRTRRRRSAADARMARDRHGRAKRHRRRDRDLRPDRSASRGTSVPRRRRPAPPVLAWSSGELRPSPRPPALADIDASSW